jgi:CBS domain-containing protein
MHEITTIMSRDVVSVNQNSPMAKAVELLVENDITGIPVVDDAGRLVGVITEKDVMGLLSDQEMASQKVKDYMTETVVSFDENEDVIAVCECLVNNPFRRVPILSGEKLAGIISRRDLIRYIMEPIGR